MKKLVLVLVAMFGLYLGANAQTDQCEIKGTSGEYLGIIKAKGELGYGGGSATISVWIEGVMSPGSGGVLCDIKYETSDGIIYTQKNVSLEFSRNSTELNKIYLDYKAEKLISIDIYNGWCKDE